MSAAHPFRVITTGFVRVHDPVEGWDDFAAEDDFASEAEARAFIDACEAREARQNASGIRRARNVTREIRPLAIQETAR